MLLTEIFNGYNANAIFFARSKLCPKLWHYDHVGFILENGKQIQMSGHRIDDGVYITDHITDDVSFPQQELKIVNLSKTVLVPTTNTVHAENCSTFVGKILVKNGVKITSRYLNNVFVNGIM